MKIVGIIQARMGSSRFPGKVLKEAAGKPLILHMVERVLRCRRLDGLCVATSQGVKDDPLAAVVQRSPVRVYRGSESDVLDRYWKAAREEQADAVVRLTGDCPLHDPEVIDEVVDAYLKQKDSVDYLSNTLMRTYPDGLDVEVFSFEALRRAANEAADPFHREHVTPYIHRFRDGGGGPFRVAHHTLNSDFSHLRWTVNEPVDYRFVKQVFERLYPQDPAFGWLDVLSLMTREPHLLEINRHLVGQQGVA
ncbi:MAG: cytidylyltransferase domain-containing protein [Nitrospinota bacterium]